MTSELDRKNRLIAEALEPRPEMGPAGNEYLGEHRCSLREEQYWRYIKLHVSPKQYWEWRPWKLRWEPRDFYTDEAANALVLEAMPFVTLAHYSDKKGDVITDEPFWECATKGVHAESPNRLTAICEAFLKWKEIVEP